MRVEQRALRRHRRLEDPPSRVEPAITPAWMTRYMSRGVYCDWVCATMWLVRRMI